jgi:hypothetical protein
MYTILRDMLQTPQRRENCTVPRSGSTFRRYLVIQLGVFVCGIVGPIFLIMFFASAPEPQMRWAYWWGLIITYIDIMVAIALTAGTRDRDQVPQKVR